jgi:diacylglycerol kinase family enzyme
MYKIAFLINPVSGGGAGAEVYGRLEEILGSFGVKRDTWTAALTETGRLEEQTDALIRSSRKLIAVGGDGTLGIVLDRVRRLRPSTVIGLIPLGTGNDLGRALGVYRVYDAKGLIACLKRLLRAPSLPFDLWDAGRGSATVVSYLSAGMDAAVLRDFDQARRREGGVLRGGALGNKLFYLRAMMARAHHRFPLGARARLDTDHGVIEIPLEGRCALLAANINSYAAGARPVPGNRFDDGLLEIVVFDTLWRYLMVVAATRILPGAARWIRPPRWRARKVELFLPPETPVQIDGEDFTGRLPESPLTVTFAARVRLLDLRRSFYALF